MALKVGDVYVKPGQEMELEPNEEGCLVVETTRALKVRTEEKVLQAQAAKEAAKDLPPQYTFDAWQTPLLCACPPQCAFGPDPCCLLHVKGLACSCCPPSCKCCCIQCPPECCSNIGSGCPTCSCPTCTCCPPSCTWCDITCPPKCDCLPCPCPTCTCWPCPPSCTCCDITCPPKCCTTCECCPSCCGVKTVGIACILCHCTTTMYPKCCPACLCCTVEVIDAARNKNIYRGKAAECVSSVDVKMDLNGQAGGPEGEEMQR
ncbi:hypothetical protein EMIHUDRAFT_109743 [Emiliania huxleyi CCMP1516]|uniref:Uncharacterized protein n=2 Tax=Emiliania huxleyi TaxID=2903 RepID=A0A0D3KP08_EMIH1|nr:hypothetical protein EMIHUDRAFT_109743 [Emiliania huxleyi CCMP1516]EOD37493.1 hypothetical protein EMIHUDRAFT_109743 [Emiliania huxleyi CCMP1516]|eukprot:XP_005789922.1 hypothetical protein EMIHUDRAFT_109743 [Emiliania huxleyi CCMP1516]